MQLKIRPARVTAERFLLRGLYQRILGIQLPENHRWDSFRKRRAFSAKN
jgi:hypothetical protein